MALLNFIGLHDDLFYPPELPDRRWPVAFRIDPPIECGEEVDLGCLICFDPTTCPHVPVRPALPPMRPPPETLLSPKDRIDLALTRIRHEFGSLEHAISAAGRVGVDEGVNRQAQLVIAAAFAERALALCTLLGSLRREGK
jgi:hypothetical protein